MRLIKTAYQTTESASETLYVIKGVFKKRVYMVAGMDMFELVQHSVKEIKNDKETK